VRCLRRLQLRLLLRLLLLDHLLQMSGLQYERFGD
jgi:hypothetical protein